MAHYRFITVRCGILWYVRLHCYSMQDIMASRVSESQVTHTIFHTDLDTNMLVFTHNNDTSQVHVISEQSCH